MPICIECSSRSNRIETRQARIALRNSEMYKAQMNWIFSSLEYEIIIYSPENPEHWGLGVTNNPSVNH